MAAKRVIFEDEILKCLEENSDLSDEAEDDEVDDQLDKESGQVNQCEILTDESEDEEVLEEIEVPEISEKEFKTLGIKLSDLVDLVPQSSSKDAKNTRIQLTQKKNIVWKNRVMRNQELVAFVPPKDKVAVETPFQYFQKYFDDDFFDKAAYYTNLYAIQKGKSSFKTTCADEMRIFFGLHIIMSCMKLHRVRTYFDKRWEMPSFYENMTSNRFFLLRNHLHITDNLSRPKKCDDRMYKVRPVIEQVRRRLHQLSLEENQMNDISAKDTLDFLNFRADVANVLIRFQKNDNTIDIPRKGRPRLSESFVSNDSTEPTENPHKRKRTNQMVPAVEIRYDGQNHLPEFLENENAGRCKMEGCTKKSFIICKKCNIYLCVKRESNCFINYHTK